MEKKFLHTLVPGLPTNSPIDVKLGGVSWRGVQYGNYDNLTHHVVGRACTILDIGFGSDERGFKWEYSAAINDERSVFFRAYGFAPTAEDAAVAALAYVPDMYTLDYLGSTSTWYGFRRPSGECDYLAVIDGERAEVCGPRQYHNGLLFHWERSWEPGKLVLQNLVTSTDLDGYAVDLEAAFIKCIDAPEMFKRGCAALIASIKPTAVS